MLNKRHTQQAAFHCSPKVTQQESAFLCLQLWALGQSGELQLLNMFAQTASPVQSITLHPSKQSILMAVTDGTISLWQLDTLGELYRYKHEGCVEGLSFTDTDDFYFFSGPQVWHEHYCNLTGTFYKRLQQTWLAVAVNMLSPLTCMTQKQAYFEAPAISPSMLHHCLCKQHLLQELHGPSRHVFVQNSSAASTLVIVCRCVPCICSTCSQPSAAATPSPAS